MKLTVPRSSSAPNRPQLETRRAMSRMRSMRSGRRFRQQAERLDVAGAGEQRRDGAPLPDLDALPDAIPRSGQRDLVGELVRHRGGGLVPPAGEAEVLDAIDGLSLTHAAHEVGVEVLLLG